MSRTETLASHDGHDDRPHWWVRRTAPSIGEPKFEPLDIHVNDEFDLTDPVDRAAVGQIAQALRHALDTSTDSWAGGM